MNVFQSLSLKKHLLNGFILCALLTAIAGGAGIYSLKQLEKNMRASSGQIISTFDRQNLRVSQLIPLRAIIAEITDADTTSQLSETKTRLADIRASLQAASESEQDTILAGMDQLFSHKDTYLETRNQLTNAKDGLQKNLEAITALAGRAQTMTKESSDREIEAALNEIKDKFGGVMAGNAKAAAGFKIDKAVSDVAMATSLAISSIQAALFLQSECYQLNVLIKDALASADPGFIDASREKTEKLLPQMVTDLVELPEGGTKAEIGRLIQTLKGSIAEIVSAKLKMLDATAAFAATVQDIQARMRKVDESVIAAARDTTTGIHSSLTQNTDLVGRWRNIQIGIGGSALLLALGLGFVLAGFIAKTIHGISTSLADSSIHVTDAASQLSGASDSLAEGASEQAASMEETTASLQEISQMTKRNAKHADHAMRVMGENIDTIKVLCVDMEKLLATMVDMVATSEETGKIVKTIDAIAFQTNLLALNAAVEAARAGEAGAGFAVVATEVGNLSKRTAEAVKTTSELIRNSQGRIKDGATMVADTNRTIQGMAEQAGNVQKLVSEISQASNDQAESVSQILIAVNEINSVTQRIAANAEESAGAAKEMNHESSTLEGVVGELEQMIRGGRKKSLNRA